MFGLQSFLGTQAKAVLGKPFSKLFLIYCFIGTLKYMNFVASSNYRADIDPDI